MFDFIELNRIIKNRKNEQVIVKETIKISEIKTFRPWHKASTDTFKGDAIMIVLYNKNKTAGEESSPEDEKNLNTMLVQENYDDLMKRLSGRVIIVGR